MLLFDIGTVTHISKYRCKVQLHQQYDDPGLLNQIENEMNLRITQFIWRISAELKLSISKDAVVSNMENLDRSWIDLSSKARSQRTHKADSLSNIDNTEDNASPLARSIQIDTLNEVNNDNEQGTDTLEFESGFHPPSPLLDVSVIDSSPFEDNNISNMRARSIDDAETITISEEEANLIETVENSPRVLFLISIICGGILLMICIFTLGLCYFCCKKLRWELSQDKKIEITAKMASISKAQYPQFIRFQPVLKELKSFDFEVCSTCILHMLRLFISDHSEKEKESSKL